MPKKNNEKYNGNSIDVLEGLEAVRIRPGMYIGSTGSKGLHHCVFEIVDNSIDESLAGYCDNIYVSINKDNSITVEDNGRGIPVDIHPKMKIPTVRVIYTILHAGGKFREGAYQKSGGLHGVGASVVNALSKWVEVEVYRDGNIYKDRYENGGNPVTKLSKGELPVIGKTNKNGTKVTFLPDDTIFETTEWKAEYLSNRFKEMAYLNKGIKITFENKKTGEVEIFHSEKGIEGFIDELTENKSNLTDSIFITGSYNNIDAEIAFKISDEFGEHLVSYCNNISTIEGGTHVTGFKSGLTKVINSYSKDFNLKENLDGRDIRTGITAIISIKHSNPQYEGQTKTKLGNSDAKIAVENILVNEAPKFFDRNYEILKVIIDNAKKMMNLREKEDAKKISIPKETYINSHKLASCSSNNPDECEISIVEGDSAGGTAKQARNRKYQAILALRGKPTNVEKATLEKVLNNQEFRTLIGALNCGYGEDTDISKIRYKKIIILTDADVDGAHIRTLLMTFFYRYMKDVILSGYLYIAEPPLYKVSKKVNKKEIIKYAYSDSELEKVKKEMGANVSIQRYKGLGEMNADQLHETVFDPKTRRLYQISIDDAIMADKLTEMLMGDVVAPRREFIIKHSIEANIDI